MPNNYVLCKVYLSIFNVILPIELNELLCKLGGYRLPKELSCGDSLMPLHSVTASVLLKSLLSSEVGQWGSLSEGTNQFLLTLLLILFLIFIDVDVKKKKKKKLQGD